MCANVTLFQSTYLYQNSHRIFGLEPMCSCARTISRINSADRRLAKPLPVLGRSGAGGSCDVREHVGYSTYSTFTLLNARSRTILMARYYERLDYGLPSLGRNYRKIRHSSRFCFSELKMDDVALKSGSINDAVID